MLNEKLSVVVSPEKDAIIQQLLDNLLAEMTFLLLLAIEDRRRLSKMGRRDLDFVYRTFKHASGSPTYIPPYLILEEFKKDVDLSIWLRKIEKKMGLIFSKVKDTALIAESEAYQSARLYYKSVVAAANAGDEEAEKISRELSIHFRKKNSSNEEEPLPQLAQETKQ